MSKRIFLFYIFCMGIFINGMAQHDPSNWLDVIELHSGSVIKGKILNYDYGSEMEFELVTGVRIVLDHSDIKTITQEQIGGFKKPYQFKEKGFYNATDFMILAFDERTDGYPAAGVTTVFGHMFKRQIGAGVGLAVHNYAIGGDEMIYALFAEARGYLNQKNVSPFYAIKSGYGFAANHNDLLASDGGLFISPSFGYRMGASTNTNFTMAIGWNIQKASFTRQGSWWINETIEQRILYKRFFITFGLLF